MAQSICFYILIGVDFGEKGEILTHKGLKICTGQIQELVLGGLNQAVAGQLVNSVDILRDSYTGKGGCSFMTLICDKFSSPVS